MADMENWDDGKENMLIELLRELLADGTFREVERASQAANVRCGDLVNVALEATDWGRIGGLMKAIHDEAALLEAEGILSRDDGAGDAGT